MDTSVVEHEWIRPTRVFVFDLKYGFGTVRKLCYRKQVVKCFRNIECYASE